MHPHSPGSPANERHHHHSPHLEPAHRSPHSSSLPPIRQLHPLLPPPTSHWPSSSRLPTDHQRLQSSPPDAYTSSPHADFYSQRHESDDLDEGDPNEPPKKKRRRQALSCTECKRRKIKCDRSQPCGPCNRRGEPLRCQWHVVEPVDKHMPRAEYEEREARHEARYNELRSRVEHLEALIQTHIPHAWSSPGPSTSRSGRPSSTASDIHHHPLHASAIPSSEPLLCQGILPSLSSYNRGDAPDTLPPARSLRSTSPQLTKRPRDYLAGMSSSNWTPGSSRSVSSPHLLNHHPTHPTRSKPDNLPPLSSLSAPIASTQPLSSRHSALPPSLATITIPYNDVVLDTARSASISKDSYSDVSSRPSFREPKNCHAQMLNNTLGGHLRSTVPPFHGSNSPATLISIH